MTRTAVVDRETHESKVHVEVDLDGTGRSDVSTGVGFFDHMLASFARHALVDLVVHTNGDTHIDAHHSVEDTAIVLGDALREALGDKSGIRRFGDATVPLDEALVQAVVDVSGRPYCVHTGEPDAQAYVLIGDTYLGSLTRHVFETLAFHAQLALHVRVLSGRDPHHLVEAQFKAFARAFRDAVAIDPRESGVPSTKGDALSPMKQVVVLDYGSGNVRSAVRALERAGAEVTLTADRHGGAGGRRARRAGRRRVRGVHGRAARRTRPRGHRPAPRRRPSGARHLRGHAGAVRAGVEHGWRPRLRRVAGRGRAAAGARRPAHGLEHRRGAPGLGALRRRRGGAVLLRALVRRPALGTGDARPDTARRWSPGPSTAATASLPQSRTVP